MVDVILPVLDEAEALPWVLGRMPAGHRAIVVDNGSTDGSGELAASLGAIVVVEPQRGFGAACLAGLARSETAIVCFMDCDGSLDPQELGLVTRPVAAGSAHLVLGARRARAGAWPWHARVANRAVARLIQARTGLRLDDLGPMRAVRRQDLLALGLRDRRFGWPLEMVLRAHGAGWRVEEVEVAYLPRAGGHSKVTGTALGTARTVRDMAAVLR